VRKVREKWEVIGSSSIFHISSFGILTDRIHPERLSYRITICHLEGLGA